MISSAANFLFIYFAHFPAFLRVFFFFPVGNMNIIYAFWILVRHCGKYLLPLHGLPLHSAPGIVLQSEVFHFDVHEFMKGS